MSLMKVFDIAGSGMSAQSLRLNLIASNLANADATSASDGGTYRARYPVFTSAAPEFRDALFAVQDGPEDSVGVRVAGIVESQAPLRRQYQPEHPLADAQGYITLPNVNPIEEMANMISASRSYQTNAQIMDTSKQLLLRTLTLGQ
jgi:flagellar basal-body rod protein FlgC